VRGREVAGCDRLRYGLCRCTAGFRLMASGVVLIIMASDIELTDAFDFFKTPNVLFEVGDFGIVSSRISYRLLSRTPEDATPPQIPNASWVSPLWGPAQGSFWVLQG
jgi:hypothetical protein